MKKMIGVITLACALTFVISSCSNSYDPVPPIVEGDELETIMAKYNSLDWSYDGDPTQIRLAHWDSAGRNIEEAVIKAMLKGFNKRYPTIDVKLEIIGDYESNYGNNISAGNMHDVCLVPDGAFGSWASAKKFENLTPYINSSDILDTNKMYETAVTRYQYNFSTNRPGSGVQLALPKDIGPYVMYYNADLFEQMGVPLPPKDRILTIEEATTMWQALTKRNPSNDTITSYGVGGLCIEGLVWSAGGDFLNETRDSFPTDPTTLAGLKKGYQYMQDAYFQYAVQPPSEFTAGQDAAALFSNQRVATFIGGRYNVTSFSTLEFNWNVAYVPAFSENLDKNMYSGSVGYAMSSACKNKVAAWKLIEYIASEEGQEILSSTGFQIPVYSELALSKDVKDREEKNHPGIQYDIFCHAASTQSYGLWQYRNNQQWKTMGYDTTSEYLFHKDPAKRWTVDYFLTQAKEIVNQNLF